ncbi:hypothetical protein QG37_03783 [Candidozyma auris]|uniref:Uncharacterized protein n=1 Tax=Candidozyma auris TaxID=498019 RepID=A0A0L0NYH0_CANAR|nr:hypothetical protein QG37_03783 [[Candida] auris]
MVEDAWSARSCGGAITSGEEEHETAESLGGWDAESRSIRVILFKVTGLIYATEVACDTFTSSSGEVI